MVPTLAFELPVCKVCAARICTYLCPLSWPRSPVKTFQDSTCVSCKDPSRVPSKLLVQTWCLVGDTAAAEESRSPGYSPTQQAWLPTECGVAGRHLNPPFEALPSLSQSIIPRFRVLKYYCILLIDLLKCLPFPTASSLLNGSFHKHL